MRFLPDPVALVPGACWLLLAASVAVAQEVGTVVESPPYAFPGAGAGPGSANSDALQLLLDQNRQMRTEVQALRAMVEEQGFEIRKLQREALGRYTDMDDRLRLLETGPGSGSPSPSATVSPSPGPEPLTAANAPVNRLPDGFPSSPDAGNAIDPAAVSQPPDNSTLSPAVAGTGRSLLPAGNRGNAGVGGLEPTLLSEQQLYQMAYDSVIDSRFERSVAEFDQYLSIYPEGRFVTNSHYWKGQAYLYLERFAEARDAYEVIVDHHPDSAKLPDALYGLALAYQGLGNLPQARRLLTDIKRRFPNTGVANLADTRLLSLD